MARGIKKPHGKTAGLFSSEQRVMSSELKSGTYGAILSLMAHR